MVSEKTCEKTYGNEHNLREIQKTHLKVHDFGKKQLTESEFLHLK